MWIDYPSSNLKELLGFASWETTQLFLPTARDHQWQFLSALASAIPGASTKNMESIADYLLQIRPPNTTDSQRTFGQPADTFAKTFDDAVSKEHAYHRALIYRALNRNGYFGFSDRYVKAVREAATDADAFPHGVPAPYFWEDPINNSRVVGWFKHDVYTTAQTIDTLAASKNSRISRFLLRPLNEPLAFADAKRLSGFLDDPDPELRWMMASKLSQWFSEPQHAPAAKVEIRGIGGNSKTEYPGLDATAAYWKSRLAG